MMITTVPPVLCPRCREDENSSRCLRAASGDEQSDDGVCKDDGGQ